MVHQLTAIEKIKNETLLIEDHLICMIKATQIMLKLIDELGKTLDQALDKA